MFSSEGEGWSYLPREMNASAGNRLDEWASDREAIRGRILVKGGRSSSLDGKSQYVYIKTCLQASMCTSVQRL